jgi:uroporphyrinogen decarboxylase
MDSTERVTRALSFQPPDRVPLIDSFWPEFVDLWRREKGRDVIRRERGDGDLSRGEQDIGEEDVASYYGVDIRILAADESPWPSRAAELERRDGYTVRRDGWGKTIGESDNGLFYDEIDMPLKGKVDLDRLDFEPVSLASRYATCDARLARLRSLANPPCVFAKVGGPYQRTGQNLRGVEQFLIDVVEDPRFVRELAGRVTDHLIEVGLESLRRFDCYDTGIWIFDDLAYNHGVMVGPRRYDALFLPLVARMVEAFKASGARKVILHSDGDLRSVLDGLVEVGIDGINPVEPKANMDAVALRRRYGDRLALVGGICNAHILPRGTDAEVREHVLSVLSAGADGGLVVGSHSISYEVSVARYDYFISLIREFGRYPLPTSAETK